MKQPRKRSKGNVQLCKWQLREVAEHKPRQTFQSEVRRCVEALDPKRLKELRRWTEPELERATRWVVVLQATLQAIDAIDKAD